MKLISGFRGACFLLHLVLKVAIHEINVLTHRMEWPNERVLSKMILQLPLTDCPPSQSKPPRQLKSGDDLQTRVQQNVPFPHSWREVEPLARGWIMCPTEAEGSILRPPPQN